ncbi:MAG: adenosine kinase, partial [Tannerella sp.]|nr:adenosine kinase [Tannerella sp.]
MSTLCLGNALVDILLRLDNDDRLREIGIAKGAMDMIEEGQSRQIQEQLSLLPRSQSPGGSACNVARALAALGGKAGFVGKIGADAAGASYEEAIAAAGVSPHLVKTAGLSGNCTVMISPDGERSMGTFLGPAPTLVPADLPEALIASYDIIYIEGYLIVNEPLVRSTMEKAKKQGVRVALDLANFNIVNGFKPLLEDLVDTYVDLLFANASEAEAFTGLPAEAAICELGKRVEIATVTLGYGGALVAASGKAPLRVKA